MPHRVIDVKDTDEAMSAAIAQARLTFHQFEKNWTRNGLEGINVKFALESDSGSLEHIWFTPIRINGDQITASCANEPKNLAGLRFGDVKTVDRSRVSDWMIMENGECYGGYTIRILSELDPANAPPLKFADYPTTEITTR